MKARQVVDHAELRLLQPVLFGYAKPRGENREVDVGPGHGGWFG